MMFAKIIFTLATVAVAYGQFLPNAGVRVIPLGGVQNIGLTAAQPQFFLAGTAAPAIAGIRVLQQPSLQFVAQPQTVTVAAQQPQFQLFQQAAPAAARIQVAAPAPAPAPARIEIAAPAPAPAPARFQFTAPPAPTVEEDTYEPGTPVAPYAFSFDESDEYGMNLKRSETSENGIVSGSYSFTTPEGYTRIVRYVSDEKGFRADVETNEPGTQTSSTADAEYRSSAPPTH